MTLLDNQPISAPRGRTPATDQAQQLREMMRQSQGESAQPAQQPRAPQREIMPPATAADRPRPIGGRRAKVIAITSGKGGVGKTNLAVNLAARFAQAGKRVVLLDADMGLANADVLCGLDLRHNLAHVIARRMRLADVMADGPGGFKLIGGASGLARMADLPDAEHQRLVESLVELERSFEIILIDTGAGISPNVLSFTRAADQVLVVTTPEPTAITDAYATIKVILRERGPGDNRPLSLLVNQVRSATEARAVFERVAKVAREFLGVNVEDGGYLPHDPTVGRAVRARSPFLLSHPSSAASVCVTRLAMRLAPGMSPRPASAAATASRESFFGRLGRVWRGDGDGPAAITPALM